MVEVLGYWDLAQMPRSHIESTHQLPGGWIGGQHQFVVGETAYDGLVTPRLMRPCSPLISQTTSCGGACHSATRIAKLATR
jgi:hypothetical protein